MRHHTMSNCLPRTISVSPCWRMWRPGRFMRVCVDVSALVHMWVCDSPVHGIQFSDSRHIIHPRGRETQLALFPDLDLVKLGIYAPLTPRFQPLGLSSAATTGSAQTSRCCWLNSGLLQPRWSLAGCRCFISTQTGAEIKLYIHCVYHQGHMYKVVEKWNRGWVFRDVFLSSGPENYILVSDVLPRLSLSWQIAASYGSIVCVFEPVQYPDQKDTSLTVSRRLHLPPSLSSLSLCVSGCSGYQMEDIIVPLNVFNTFSLTSQLSYSCI